MVLLGLVYAGWISSVQVLTGIRWLDGSIGVLLGLYICSHPAANAVDLLFFQRAALRQMSSEWPGIGWLGLNLLVLVIGWVAIMIGVMRIAGIAV
jgi:hypothetical protein